MAIFRQPCARKALRAGPSVTFYCSEAKAGFLGLLNETQRIVLNLVWIEYIDSRGLGTLVASFISARNRGAEIKFSALSPRARRVLTSTKVDRLLRFTTLSRWRSSPSILTPKLPLGDISSRDFTQNSLRVLWRYVNSIVRFAKLVARAETLAFSGCQ